MPTVAQCHAVRRDVPGAAFERRRPTADPCASRTTYNVPPLAACNVSADTARTHVPSAPTDLILATLQSGILLDVRPPWASSANVWSSRVSSLTTAEAQPIQRAGRTAWKACVA